MLLKPRVIAFTFVAVVFPAWAVHKCNDPDGKVSYQDVPCVGQGVQFDVRPATGLAQQVVPLMAPQAKVSTATAPAAQSAPAGAVQLEEKTPLQIESSACLDWYRPMLRDPVGAYFTEPSKDGRVVSITVHATNGFGGYVTKRAACEFKNSQLDLGWTKIHAKRAGWSVD